MRLIAYPYLTYAQPGMTKRAEQIKILMRDRGVTIKKLMDDLKLSRPTVSRFVRGLKPPSYEQRVVIADSLRVPIEQVDNLFTPSDTAPIIAKMSSMNADARGFVEMLEQLASRDDLVEILQEVHRPSLLALYEAVDHVRGYLPGRGKQPRRAAKK